MDNYSFAVRVKQLSEIAVIWYNSSIVFITEYVIKFMDAVKTRRLEFPSYSKALEAAAQTGIVAPLPLTASYQHVPKQVLIDRHRSRYQ